MVFHPQPNALAEVVVSALDAHGTGLAQHEGSDLLVPGALPGERARVRLLQRTGSRGPWRTQVQELLETAPARRVQLPCPIWQPDCACPLMPLDDAAQATHKRALVVAAFAGVPGVSVEPLVPAKEALAYRSKVVLVCRSRGDDGRHGERRTLLGAYRRGSHHLLDLDGCVIEEPAIAAAVGWLRDHLRDVTGFDERTGRGELRYVVARATQRGEVMLAWIGAALPAFAKPLAEALMQAQTQVRGVSWAENQSHGNAIWGRAPAVLLAGESHLIEEVDGLSFAVSPRAFFQVHRAQAARLRARLLELIGGVSGGSCVWDLYCGVGVNALCLAKKGATVVGVEGFADAVLDAQNNAAKNDLSARASFVHADLDARHALDALSGSAPDVVIVNPPRKGASLALLADIAARRPRHIVYVACAPKPLGPAAHTLLAQGYETRAVVPFDLFPQTEHVETLTLFSLQQKA